MEVIYTTTTTTIIIIIIIIIIILFFNRFHDKFLAPPLLIPLEKNPGIVPGRMFTIEAGGCCCWIVLPNLWQKDSVPWDVPFGFTTLLLVCFSWATALALPKPSSNSVIGTQASPISLSPIIQRYLNLTTRARWFSWALVMSMLKVTWKFHLGFVLPTESIDVFSWEDSEQRLLLLSQMDTRAKGFIFLSWCTWCTFLNPWWCRGIWRRWRNRGDLESSISRRLQSLF